MWQVYFFYAHHAAAVRKPTGNRSSSHLPLFQELLPVPVLTGTAKYDEKLLQHQDFLQLLSDFKLMSKDIK